MDMSSEMSMAPTIAGAAMSTASSATAAAAAATSEMAIAMDIDMDMGMEMPGDSCEMSMLWNWYTVNACFISSSWQITSNGMFAGSCIGVICLVMSLFALRRLHRAYDASIMRSRAREESKRISSAESSPPPDEEKKVSSTVADAGSRQEAGLLVVRPSVVQQLLRATLYAFEFAVAYFVMLLAMYFNGYIIISIFIGAFLGYFVFDWEVVCGKGAGPEGTVCCA